MAITFSVYMSRDVCSDAGMSSAIHSSNVVATRGSSSHK